MKKNIDRKNSNISNNSGKRKKENYNNNHNYNHDKVNANLNNSCNCDYNYDCGCKDNNSICYCLDIRKASHHITKLYTRSLNPTGLTITQFGILKHIQAMEPVNVTNLAKELNLDRTTLVRSLKILEKKGFIKDISEEKTRNRKLILSKAGNKTLDKATVLWKNAQKRLENYLGKKDLQKLLELVSKLENI